MRSRSEATASRSREAGLIMRHSGCDDVNKRQCSFAIIATIFIGSLRSDENHFSSSALFNLAARDFASRGLIFSTYWQFRSEEVTAVGHCRHGRRRTFGLDGQKWSSSAYNGPSSTLTLNNPFGEKRGWAIYFYVQFYPTPTFRAKSADIGMSPGRKATLPGSCPR